MNKWRLLCRKPNDAAPVYVTVCGRGEDGREKRQEFEKKWKGPLQSDSLLELSSNATFSPPMGSRTCHQIQRWDM